jgi:hypothetical protein
MLALDSPFLANSEESQELCLEYGSATQVYLVPIAQQEEQVGWNILVLLLLALLPPFCKIRCIFYKKVNDVNFD